MWLKVKGKKRKHIRRNVEKKIELEVKDMDKLELVRLRNNIQDEREIGLRENKQ